MSGVQVPNSVESHLWEPSSQAWRVGGLVGGLVGGWVGGRVGGRVVGGWVGGCVGGRDGGRVGGRVGGEVGVQGEQKPGGQPQSLPQAKPAQQVRAKPLSVKEKSQPGSFWRRVRLKVSSEANSCSTGS